jgi:hypothetical protein
MLPINNPERVTIVINRSGYIYNLRPGSLVVHGDYVTFEARSRGHKDYVRTTISREEIGTVTEETA